MIFGVVHRLQLIRLPYIDLRLKGKISVYVHRVKTKIIENSAKSLKLKKIIGAYD